jgi:hypothetical protein
MIVTVAEGQDAAATTAADDESRFGDRDANAPADRERRICDRGGRNQRHQDADATKRRGAMDKRPPHTISPE